MEIKYHYKRLRGIRRDTERMARDLYKGPVAREQRRGALRRIRQEYRACLRYLDMIVAEGMNMGPYFIPDEVLGRDEVYRGLHAGFHRHLSRMHNAYIEQPAEKKPEDPAPKAGKRRPRSVSDIMNEILGYGNV